MSVLLFFYLPRNIHCALFANYEVYKRLVGACFSTPKTPFKRKEVTEGSEV